LTDGEHKRRTKALSARENAPPDRLVQTPWLGVSGRDQLVQGRIDNSCGSGQKFV